MVKYQDNDQLKLQIIFSVQARKRPGEFGTKWTKVGNIKWSFSPKTIKRLLE